MMEWIKKNDIASKILSVACAVLLWFYVVSSTNPDMTQTYSRVEVELTGMESLVSNNLVIVNGSQSTVSFRVSGQSERISMVSVNDGLTVTADLSNITSPGEYDIKYQVISSVTDLTISKITPVITIEVDRIVSKSVPVDLSIKGNLQNGFVSDNLVLTPDAITVTGPEKLLDTIVSAKAFFDISSITMTTEATLSYTLINSEGEEVKSSLMTVDTPSVKLSYGVRQTGEIPFMVTVNSFGFIDSNMVDITLEPETVKVSGSPDVVSTLNRIDLGSINLEQIFENETFEFELPVILPNGVTAGDAVTSVKVTVTPKELTKATIELTRDILPESSLFQYASDLIITVWTTEDNLSTLSADSVDIFLSYSEGDLVQGLNELTVTITPVNDDIVIVGDYTIVVEVP